MTRSRSTEATSEDHIKRTGKVLTEFLRGIAKLEGRDRFAVAGLETDRKTPIETIYVRSPTPRTKIHWRANIGFHTNDWNSTSRRASRFRGTAQDNISMTCLQRDPHRGHVDNIRVGIEET